MTYVTKIHGDSNGDELDVESGGRITVLSGGIIDVRTGGIVQANGTQAGAIANLTMTVGTADNTVADVGAAYTQATLNNNFRDLGEKINGILAALRGVGIIAP